MTRDDLIEAGALALVGDRYPGMVKPNTYHRDIAAVVVDAVEPLIRADEGGRIAAALWRHVEPITTWIAGANR